MESDQWKVINYMIVFNCTKQGIFHNIVDKKKELLTFYLI